MSREQQINFQNASLEASAYEAGQIPPSTLPEVIFAGRSNVGKSSLINAITGQKNLARVSQRPGKTTAILFFNVDKKVHLVDLPGYGYAASSYARKNQFSNLVSSYLEEPHPIQLVFLIVDARRGLQADEGDFLAWANAHNLDVRIILNKADQLKQRDKQLLLNEFGRDALLTSATKRTGIRELREIIAEALDYQVKRMD